MKKEDKDLLDKIHSNISLITVVPSYQEIHDFVLADRKERKEKLLKKLPSELKVSSPEDEVDYKGASYDTGLADGQNSTLGQIKKIIEEQL